MTSGGLDTLLNPRSVAVIGATDEVFTFKGASIHNLVQAGFTGAIYPVNPRREEVQGLRCYRSVSDLPEVVDTAIITTSAPVALQVLEECEQVGVGSATVIGSGFGEEGAGPAGEANGKRLEHFLARAKIRVLGPNTAGLMNLLDGYVPRAAVNHHPDALQRAGSVALLTQSGACSNIVFNRAAAHGVGIGLMAATGDESDVGVWELVGRAIDDPRIAVIMLVTESQGDPDTMRHAAERARRVRKPIVLLRLGVSELGSAVVLTHSGSIAGDVAVSREALRAWGVLEVSDFDELWRTALLFERWGVDGAAGLGVFAFSGGEAALIADHASEAGLDLPAVGAGFASRVDEVLSYAKAANPFDATGELVGSPDKLDPLMDSFLKDNSFGSVLVATPVYRAEAAERVLPRLVDVLRDRAAGGPHIALSMWDAGELTRRQKEILESSGLPVLDGSPAAVDAIARYRRYGEWLADASSVRGERTDVAEADGGSIEFASARYGDIRAGLADLGLPFLPARVVTSPGEVRAALQELRTPVVMKGNVDSTVHKAEADLIRLGVGDVDSAVEAFAELMSSVAAHGGEGVVVEETAHGSLQCFVGARRDPQFGAVIVFGLGGSAAEFLDDTALGLAADFGAQQARALLGRTRVGSFLLAHDRALAEMVMDLLSRVARWFVAASDVAELDLNPVIVDTTRSRLACVDARVYIRREEGR